MCSVAGCHRGSSRFYADGIGLCSDHHGSWLSAPGAGYDALESWVREQGKGASAEPALVACRAGGCTAKIEATEDGAPPVQKLCPVHAESFNAYRTRYPDARHTLAEWQNRERSFVQIGALICRKGNVANQRTVRHILYRQGIWSAWCEGSDYSNSIAYLEECYEPVLPIPAPNLLAESRPLGAAGWAKSGAAPASTLERAIPFNLILRVGQQLQFYVQHHEAMRLLRVELPLHLADAGILLPRIIVGHQIHELGFLGRMAVPGGGAEFEKIGTSLSNVFVAERQPVTLLFKNIGHATVEIQGSVIYAPALGGDGWQPVTASHYAGGREEIRSSDGERVFAHFYGKTAPPTKRNLGDCEDGRLTHLRARPAREAGWGLAGPPAPLTNMCRCSLPLTHEKHFHGPCPTPRPESAYRPKGLRPRR